MIDSALASSHRNPMSKASAIFGTLLTLAASSVGYLRPAVATPITQTLSRSSSSVTFGINSPNPSLSMNGSFKDFRGTIALNPDSITDSNLELSLSLASAQLPPDQILQAVFLQTAIARFASRPSTFESSSIEHLRDKTYLINGSYTWMNKRKVVSIPVEVSKATPSLTEIRLFLDGSFTNKNAPSEFSHLANSAQGSKGWTKAVLIFTPAARS